MGMWVVERAMHPTQADWLKGFRVSSYLGIRYARLLVRTGSHAIRCPGGTVPIKGQILEEFESEILASLAVNLTTSKGVTPKP